MTEQRDEHIELTPAEKKRRRQKNLAIGGALIALAALFYLITLMRLSGG